MKILQATLCVVLILFIPFLTGCDDSPVLNESFNPEQGIQYYWSASTPAALGLDPFKIDTAFSVADNFDFLHGILIIKDEQIAAEKYYTHFDSLSWHSVASVSKSFTSALMGVAIDRGNITLNQKVADLFPGLIHSGADNRIYNITIEDLLQMKSGIGSDTYFEGRTFNYSGLTEGILNEPLVSNPGSSFNYSSNGVYLLTTALTKATGWDAFDYANEFLFEPMGISCAWWDKSEEGYYYSGSGMFFSLRNMAALGQLYINKGVLNGSRVISEEYINRSLTSNFNGGTSGVVSNYGYGYLWWTGNINGHDVFYASGYGGQTILCVPEINMIIVTTAKSYGDAASANLQMTSIFKLIADYIIPAKPLID